MERLDFSDKSSYISIEAAIHLNRYGIAKPFCKGARILDAACGEGYGSYLMKSWGATHVDGIDIDEGSINMARSLFKNSGLAYTVGSAEKLPFEDNIYDLVVSLETIEHLDDAESFLREIKRVLKPGGTVILSCPNDNYYYERDNLTNPFHKRRYTFFEFKELAEKYLGSYVDFFLAFALDGFINIPYERRTEPEQIGREDALGLLHYVQCDQAFCVPQERYLNQWNANYYVGIWGKMEQANRYSLTVAPRETFIDHKDIDYDLLRHLDDVRVEIRRLQTGLSDREQFVEEQRKQHAAEISRLQIELSDREQSIEEQREQHAEEVLRLQEAAAADAIRYEAELTRAKEEAAAVADYERKLILLQEENETRRMELARIRALLDLTKCERDEARRHMNENWTRYQQAEQRAEGLKELCAEAEKGGAYWQDKYQQEHLRTENLEELCAEAEKGGAYWKDKYQQEHLRAEKLEELCTEAEKGGAYWKDKYQQEHLRVESMESSRGVRLLAKFYNLRMWFKNLFSRKGR